MIAVNSHHLSLCSAGSAGGKYLEALDTLQLLASLGDVAEDTLTNVCLCRALTLSRAGREEEAEEGKRWLGVAHVF